MRQAKQHSAVEIIPKLRAVELEFAMGRTAAEAAKKIGVTEDSDSQFPLVVPSLTDKGAGLVFLSVGQRGPFLS